MVGLAFALVNLRVDGGEHVCVCVLSLLRCTFKYNRSRISTSFERQQLGKDAELKTIYISREKQDLFRENVRKKAISL